MPAGETRVSMKRRVALITGVAGQDGGYPAEFLLGKDYVVEQLISLIEELGYRQWWHLPPYFNPNNMPETP